MIFFFLPKVKHLYIRMHVQKFTKMQKCIFNAGRISDDSGVTGRHFIVAYHACQRRRRRTKERKLKWLRICQSILETSCFQYRFVPGQVGGGYDKPQQLLLEQLHQCFSDLQKNYLSERLDCGLSKNIKKVFQQLGMISIYNFTRR